MIQEWNEACLSSCATETNVCECYQTLCLRLPRNCHLGSVRMESVACRGHRQHQCPSQEYLSAPQNPAYLLQAFQPTTAADETGGSVKDHPIPLAFTVLVTWCTQCGEVSEFQSYSFATDTMSMNGACGSLPACWPASSRPRHLTNPDYAWHPPSLASDLQVHTLHLNELARFAGACSVVLG